MIFEIREGVVSGINENENVDTQIESTAVKIILIANRYQ